MSERSYLLPWPPTVNHYWRALPLGRGRMRMVLTARGSAYRVEATMAVLESGPRQPPLAGRVWMDIRACPPDRRVRDLDNILKGLLDALAYAKVYEGDHQVDLLRIERVAATPELPAGHVQVTLGDRPG